MVLDAVSNFVRGSTDAAVGTSDTTVSVVDASIFPDPATDGEFNVVIWDVNNFPRPDQDGDVEILRVTERDTTDDELTVTRGQETTSAAAHPEGSAIHLSPTAKMFSDIEDTFGDFWDAGSQELTADVNNTNTTTQSLEAEDLSRKSKKLDRHEVELDTVSATAGSDTLSVDDFDDEFENYVIEYRITQSFDDNGKVEIRINGDLDGNEDYIYWDETGTKIANQDGILIADVGPSSLVNGRLYVSHPDDRRVGFANVISPVRAARIDTFTQAGANDSTVSEITSFDIVPVDGEWEEIGSNPTEIKLLGVVA